MPSSRPAHCFNPRRVLCADHCQDCNAETLSIPRIPTLHRELAKAVLSKSAALTGQEFRFLRTVTELSAAAFAEELGVAIQTVQAWEKCDALRYLNDLGARTVIATLISPGDDWSRIFKILSSIKAKRAGPLRIQVRWSIEEAQWVVISS